MIHTFFMTIFILYNEWFCPNGQFNFANKIMSQKTMQVFFSQFDLSDDDDDLTIHNVHILVGTESKKIIHFQLFDHIFKVSPLH